MGDLMEDKDKIADALEVEAEAHSRDVHGDLDIHIDCDECKRLCKKFLEIYGITPQEYLDRFTRWPRPEEKSGLKEIAKALMEGESAWTNETKG